MSKIGINGFGRIGRLVLRAAVDKGAQVISNILEIILQLVITFLLFFSSALGIGLFQACCVNPKMKQ